MPAKYLLAAACAVALNLTTAAAFAGANDYAFEPLAAEIKKGDDVVVALRLTHKPSGKPVADAVIVRTRVDMAPDGMADMVSPVAQCRPPSLASIRSRPICRWPDGTWSASPLRCRANRKRSSARSSSKRSSERAPVDRARPAPAASPPTDDMRNAMTPRFQYSPRHSASRHVPRAGYVYWNWPATRPCPPRSRWRRRPNERFFITAIRAERRPGRPLRRTTRKAAPFFRSTTTRSRHSTRLRSRRSHKVAARFSSIAIPWGCPTPRRCRRRTRWGWITSLSMTAMRRNRAAPSN